MEIISQTVSNKNDQEIILTECIEENQPQETQQPIEDEQLQEENPAEYQNQQVQPVRMVSTPQLEEEENINSYENQFVLVFKSQQQRRLQIIFQYYCHRQFVAIGSPTFEEIKHNLNVMNLNKWMMFCKNFQLAKLMPIPEIHNLFKKHSVHNQMDFQVFLKALMQILTHSGTYEKNLQYISINSEQNWINKANSLEIPYLSPRKGEHPLKTPMATKVSSFHENNRNTESNRQKNKNHPIEKLNMKKVVFEDIRNAILPITIKIKRQQDDKTFLKEFDLDLHKGPKNRSRKMMSQNQGARKVNQTHKPDMTLKVRANSRLVPHSKDSQISKDFRKIDRTLAQPGLFKRLDERMYKFSRRF